MAETSPTPEPPDEFSEHLAALDEALAEGRDPGSGVSAPTHLRERLERAEDCLRLLAQARTRTPDGVEVTRQWNGAAAPAGAEPIRAETIGRFEIVRELGRGGCGVVFLAHDPVLRREVALKVPLPDRLATAEHRRRFLREAQAAAQLSHPNLVAVYESGEAGPIAYIASAYCPGPTLAAWLRGQKTPVPPRAAAGLVAQLAQGVHHCHAKGVLHRDLKPGNILLACVGDASSDPPTLPTDPGAAPLTAFEPKITDFGLARLESGADERTNTGAIMGTAAYMAPEQAQGDVRQIGPHTDVYALGTILYELLTGRRPFVGFTELDTLHRLIRDDPPSIGRERANVHRDLKTICMKCLEKDPKRRYASALALAEDLERFANGEPIIARPCGRFERGWRWCRRHPTVAALAALSVLFVAIVLPGWLWHTYALAESAAREQRAEALAAEEKKARAAAEENARTQRYFGLVNKVRQRSTHKPLGWTWAGLADLAEAAKLDTPARDLVELRSEAATLLAGVDLREKSVLADSFSAYCLAFSPDGKYLAAGQDLATAFLWAPVRIIEVATGKTHRTLTYPTRLAQLPTGRAPDGAICLAYSADGKQLAVGTRSGQVHCWDLTQAKPKPVSWSVSKERVNQVIFHPRQPYLYTASHADRFVKRWDPAAAKELASHQVARDVTRGIALHPHGDFLACSTNNEIHQLDVETLRDLGIMKSYVNQLAPFTCGFAPGGDFLAVHVSEGVVLLLAERTEVRRFAEPGIRTAHRGAVTAMDFSPDGSLFLSASENERDRTMKIWEVASGRLLASRRLGEAGPLAFAVHPHGKLLATAAQQRIVLHELANADVQTFRAQHAHPLQDAAFSPDGNQLACTGEFLVSPAVSELTLTTWDTATQRVHRVFGTPYEADRGVHLPIATTFHPREAILAAAGWGNRVWFFDGKKKLEPPLAAKEPGLLAFDRTGKKLWAILDAHAVQSWDWPARTEASHWRSQSLTFTGRDQLYCLTAGRRWLLVGVRDGQTHVLRTSDGQLQTSWPGPDLPIRSLALNADETCAAVGAQNGEVRIMSVPEGNILATLQDHTDSVDGLAIDPAGRFLITCSKEKRVHIYTLAGAHPTLYATLTLPTGPVRGLSFHPNGKRFALIAGPETAVRMWHLDVLERRFAELGLH